jgi:hypothetical protein
MLLWFIRNGSCFRAPENEFLPNPLEAHDVHVPGTAVRGVVVAASHDCKKFLFRVKLYTRPRGFPVVFDLLNDRRMPGLKFEDLNESNHCTAAAAIVPFHIYEPVLCSAFDRIEEFYAIQCDFLMPTRLPVPFSHAIVHLETIIVSSSDEPMGFKAFEVNVAQRRGFRTVPELRE